MVQFRNGQPDKSNYRKFKIKGGDKNDDFAAMAEIIMRRYSKLKKENLDFPILLLSMEV
jgi:excinuclease ABC subunit C